MAKQSEGRDKIMGLFAEMVRFQIYYLVAAVICRLLFIIQIKTKGPIYFLRRKGALIHELMHYLMMKILFIPAKFHTIRVGYDGSGSVSLPYNQKKSFIKFLLVAFAPLIGGTMLLLYIEDVWPPHWDTWYWVIIRWMVILSILLTISPSTTDFKRVYECIIYETRIFIKQIIFLFFSVMIYVLNYEYFIKFQTHLAEVFELVIILAIFSLFELGWWLIKKVTGLVMEKSPLKKRYSQKGIKVKKHLSIRAVADILDVDDSLSSYRKIKKAVKTRKRTMKHMTPADIQVGGGERSENNENDEGEDLDEDDDAMEIFIKTAKINAELCRIIDEEWGRTNHA